MLPKLLALSAVCLAAGCGAGGAKVAPVSGTVTMDGKPLARAYVNFQPAGTADNPNPGVGSYAVTDEQGRYTLRFSDGSGGGAVVGNHKVSIALQFAEDLGNPETGTPDGSTGPPRLGSVAQVPARYNSQSELTFVVPPGGTDKADFPLKSKPNSSR